MLDGIEPGSYFNAFHDAGTRKAGKERTKHTNKSASRNSSTQAKRATGDTAGGSGAAAGTEFSSLEAAKVAADLEHAQHMLDTIHSFGDQLRRQPNLSNLQRYRKLVQEFLNAVVSGAYGLDRQESAAGLLKRKRFTLVSTINRKLDRLAAGLVQTQQEQLDMLAAIDEVEGLLVDLIQ